MAADPAIMAALAGAVGGGGAPAPDPMADPMAGGTGNPTVDCPVCGYTLDAVTGEVVAGPEEAPMEEM